MPAIRTAQSKRSKFDVGTSKRRLDSDNTPKRSPVKLTADILEGFVNACLVHKFDEATEIPAFHREMWDMCCSDFANVAIAAPRNHAKSTSITLAYTLASILFKTADYVIILSNSESIATNFVGDLRNELLDNERIHQLFGKVVALKDTATDVIVQFEDGRKVRFVPKGAGQSMRGLKWDNKRPDLIIVDDLEDDEAVLNKDRRAKLKQWFYATVMPLRSTRGKTRVVGTILHMDSFLESLMPKPNSVMTVDEPLKVSSKIKNPVWLAAKYRAHSPDFSHILWPTRHSKEALQSIRQDFVDQGIPEVYAREYLNHPIDETISFFRKTDFLPFSGKDKSAKNLKYYVGIDLAISEKERADYTAMVVAGVDDGGRLYIVDCVRARMDSFEIIDNIFLLQEAYDPELITIESGAIQKSIGPFLRQEMHRRNVFINLNTDVPLKDKQSRARSLQARMRAGSVYFDIEADWYPVLEDEFLKFPRAKHDDIVDAASWIGLSLDKMVNAPTLKEIEDEEIEAEHEMYLYDNDFDNDKSEYCGY